MPRIPPLARIRTGCSKPNCRTGSSILHRHHRGCEAMFLRHFAARKNTKRYQDFESRYHSFDTEDVVLICDSHHAEIHDIYMNTIRRHCLKLKKPMCTWTWRQAELLIRDLRKICNDWLKKQTRGSSWKDRDYLHGAKR